jgi:hypothetical protein
MMATRKMRTKGVGLDVKKLSKELGAKVKEGKVTTVRNKYFVTVGATKKEIVVGDTTPAADVKALVGAPVAVVVSGRNIVAIGEPTRRPWILCYIPAPDLIKKIREDLRGELLSRYVDAGLIPAAAVPMLKPVAE